MPQMTRPDVTEALRRLVAVVDAASMTWNDPVPADAIDAIHNAKEVLAATPAPAAEPRRDLTLSELLDTLRWIVHEEGSLPEKGSERERRFIELWSRRLNLSAPAAEPAVTEALRRIGPPVDHCASDCCDAYPRLHVHGNHDEWNELMAALAASPQSPEPTASPLEGAVG